jgi:hypothetical protein
MDFVLLMPAFDSCRGLIHQTHPMLNLGKHNIIPSSSFVNLESPRSDYLVINLNQAQTLG